MASGLDLQATVDYILDDDKDNPPTIWKLGMIPSYIFARISSDEDNKEMEMVYRLLQVSIKGWENFNIPFVTVKEKIFGRELEVVPLSVLEQIRLKDISKLSMEVMRINQLTENEIKN